MCSNVIFSKKLTVTSLFKVLAWDLPNSFILASCFSFCSYHLLTYYRINLFICLLYMCWALLNGKFFQSRDLWLADMSPTPETTPDLLKLMKICGRNKLVNEWSSSPGLKHINRLCAQLVLTSLIHDVTFVPTEAQAASSSFVTSQPPASWRSYERWTGWQLFSRAYSGLGR